jgi:hypothetical protein
MEGCKVLCRNKKLLKINGEHCSVETEAAEIWHQYNHRTHLTRIKVHRFKMFSLIDENVSWRKGI